METLTKDRAACGPSRERRARLKGLLLALLAGTMMLAACGSSSSGGGSQIPLTLAGNWQFTMAPPPDGSFTGGLQGGFLLEKSGDVTGGATYAVSLPGQLIPCNMGSATITGSINGQDVALTAVAGTQTFALTGTLSLDSSTMSGTYTSTQGTAGNGSICGTAQTGLQWSAVLVQPLTGPVQGSFHSAGGAAGLSEQDFLLTGALTQAANTGASSAAITGNLNFLNSITGLSDYPCFTLATVNGAISGNSVTLQITATDGSSVGLIGEPVGSYGSTGVNPVTFDSVSGGYVLHGAGPSYLVATAACPGSLGNVAAAGDFGNICLALNGSSACQQPITLTPSALIFANQVVGAPATMQTITLANASGAALSGVTLNLTNDSGAANFTETDACGVQENPSLGQPFNLASGQSCAITITFTPQNPALLAATLAATSPNNSVILTVPITGTGESAGAISTRTAEDVEHHAAID